MVGAVANMVDGIVDLRDGWYRRIPCEEIGVGHPVNRSTKRGRRAATFVYQTRALRGIAPDTPEERAEKDRKIAEFLSKRKQQGDPNNERQ